MREIALDTETTGLSCDDGDRIIEIGCVEMINHVATGRTYWTYICPEDRRVHPDAFSVHGLSDTFLADKPCFSAVVREFLAFIGDDARLVIHNAAFDIGFLNAELKRCGFPPLTNDRVIDTLRLTREMFPGAQASLDALCRRFSIDNSARTLHGALKDAQLLAEVYLELRGGRQQGLGLAAEPAETSLVLEATAAPRPPRPHAPTAEELAAHAAFLDLLNDPVWRLQEAEKAA